MALALHSDLVSSEEGPHQPAEQVRGATDQSCRPGLGSSERNLSAKGPLDLLL